jgi:hypothetical protein
LRALTAIRHGASLADAAKAEGVSGRTIRKYVGSALRQDHAGGRIRAVRRDKFTRYLQIPGQDASGLTQVAAKGSREATELAAYVNARSEFLRSGDELVLRPFRGKKIGGHTLVTDPKLLTTLAEQGESFDQLYSSLAAWWPTGAICDFPGRSPWGPFGLLSVGLQESCVAPFAVALTTWRSTTWEEQIMWSGSRFRFAATTT